jgi:adenine phosphoribosyltransferase
MKSLNLDDYIRKIPDFPKKGVLFYDITSLLTAPDAFKYCIECMAEIYTGRGIDAIAAIEARGFLFAAPFAFRMGIPLVLIRKKGKLPGETMLKKYSLEYAEAEIEIHPHDVPSGRQILLMDDLIATGGTLNAARELITGCGGLIPEIFGVVGLPFLNYEEKLAPTPVRTLINYHSE